MIRVSNNENDTEKSCQPLRLLFHQKELLSRLNDESFPIYICWGMGSGKTIGALMCMKILETPGKVLIICDKSTTTQWQKEAEKVLHRNAKDFKEVEITIIHYEFMEKDEAPSPQHFDMTIVDEAHRFRNAWHKESIRMLNWMDMILKCERVIFLSGTPIVHDAKIERDAFNKMMVRKNISNRVFFYDPRTDAKSAKKYPKVTENDIFCHMSWAQCFLYMQNRRQTFSIHLENETECRTRVSSSKNTYNTMLRAISNNPFPSDPKTSPKFQMILTQMTFCQEKSQKQIVYSSRRDTGVKSLQSLWEYIGKKSSFQVTGDMSTNDRAINILKFNRCPSGVLFITDAGGQGIDLKRVDVVHIMEPAENIQDERQIINRAVRYKSHNLPDSHVDVYRYIIKFPVKGSVEYPWKKVLYESGMFHKDEMKGITRKVQYALKDLIRHEENNMSIDEKIIQTRNEREKSIQDELESIRRDALK